MGLFVRGSYLYVLEQRHIYRYTMQSDPAKDGFQFLAVERGCINNRCLVKVEDQVYLMDDTGVYRFDGDQTATPISQQIQNYWQDDPGVDGLAIDWSANQVLWHAAHDPVWHTIRWFVAMTGDDGELHHALCFDYRSDRWWIEDYPYPITSSSVGVFDRRRSIVGADARRILCLGGSVLDGADPESGTIAGSVSSADATHLTDGSAAFPSSVAGIPVTIVAGTGRGQKRIEASNTETVLEIVLARDVIPDTTSTYQLGGIPWLWRSGWLEHQDDEYTNTRDLTFVYKPLQGEGMFSCSLYYDHAENPLSYAYTTNQDGVNTTAGSPYMDFSMASREGARPGWSLYKQGGHMDPTGYGPLYVSIELSGVQTAEEMRMYQVMVAGVLPSESGNAS